MLSAMWKSLVFLLQLQSVWSFQMFPAPSSVSRPHHPLSRRLTVSGECNRDLRWRTSLAAVPSQEGRNEGDIDSERFHILTAFVTNFFAAACVLSADPGMVLAEGVTRFPSTTVTSTSSPREDAGNEIAVVPSTKLDGELAAQFQKAQSAGSVQQFDKAKKLYNQVVKYAPGYVYGWSNRANVLIAEGDLQGALADYDKALSLADGLAMPDKWVIYLNRGTTFLALGNDDRALADLNQAARLNNQKDLYTLANRAQAFERRGEWGKALIDYEGAIGVQPGNVQPWWIRYSLVLFQEGRDFDSLACLRRIQSKFEGVGEIQAALTAVNYGRGEMGEAQRSWKGINKVDQQTFLTESYLKNQLKWPPRMVTCLEDFDREVKAANSAAAERTATPTTTTTS